MGWTTPTDRSSGYVVTAADWNVVEDDLSFLYGDPAYNVVSAFTNSWTNFGAGTLQAAYRLNGVRVQLRGTIKSGTINTAAFTLPSGYRPLGALAIPVNSNNAYGAVQVTSAGLVIPIVGSNVSVDLGSVQFDVGI